MIEPNGHQLCLSSRTGGNAYSDSLISAYLRDDKEGRQVRSLDEACSVRGGFDGYLACYDEICLRIVWQYEYMEKL